MQRTYSTVLGVILVLIGLVGFMPNGLIGQVGYFYVGTALDVLYLVSGFLLLFVVRGVRNPRPWLITMGVVYLLLFLNGLIVPDMLLGFMGANMADAWLHLVLGIVFVGAAYVRDTSTVRGQVSREVNR